MAAIESPSYEVYCNACRVSFPVGTRRCVHCGGGLSKQRHYRSGDRLPPELLEVGRVDPVDLDEAELPRRSGFSPLTLVWVGLLLIGYLYRSCTGAG